MPTRRSMQVDLDPGCAFFTGHFPGRPVLPGVAHLALVERLLRRAVGAGARLASIDRLRFLRPLLPGDRLEVTLELEAGTRRAAFRVARDGLIASEGRFDWTPGGTP